MAVIRDGSSQFPFHITDIAALLRLNIRRRGPDFLYVDCPLCGDHRGKLYPVSYTHLTLPTIA